MKDRLKKKLKAKKAVKRLLNDKPKIYEMPDEYKKDLQHLSDLLQKREETVEKISKMSGEDKIFVDKTLKNIDKNIEIFENELAREYETYQAKMQREEEINEAYKKGMDHIETLYIYIKNEMPHKFEFFHDTIVKDMSEEEIQDFLDAVAVRELNASKALLVSSITE